MSIRDELVVSCRILAKDQKRLEFWKQSLRKRKNEESMSLSQTIGSVSSRDCKSPVSSCPVDDASLTREYYECKQSIAVLTKEQLNSGQFGEINRDVVRTLQFHPFFKSGQLGESMLRRILQVMLVARPEVGYCQGMNFVTAMLLLARLPPEITGHGDPFELQVYDNDISSPVTIDMLPLAESEQAHVEVDIFIIMSLLMDKNGKIGMNGLWGPDTPRMKLRVYQLDRLVYFHFPRLHRHFKEIQFAAPEMLVAQWFVTLFCYTMPPHLTFKLWDIVFVSGWTSFFRIGLSMLHLLENSFLSRDIEGIGMMLRDWKRYGQIEEFSDAETESILFSRTKSIIVNENVLEQLSETFAVEMISYSLSKMESDKYRKWLNRYGEDVSVSVDTVNEFKRVRDDIIVMEKQVDYDKQVIQSKLLKACEDCREIEERIADISNILAHWNSEVERLENDLKASISRSRHQDGNSHDIFALSQSIDLGNSSHFSDNEVAETSEEIDAFCYAFDELKQDNDNDRDNCDDNDNDLTPDPSLDDIEAVHKEIDIADSDNEEHYSSNRKRFPVFNGSNNSVPWLSFKGRSSSASRFSSSKHALASIFRNMSLSGQVSSNEDVVETAMENEDDDFENKEEDFRLSHSRVDLFNASLPEVVKDHELERNAEKEFQSQEQNIVSSNSNLSILKDKKKARPFRPIISTVKSLFSPFRKRNVTNSISSPSSPSTITTSTSVFTEADITQTLLVSVHRSLATAQARQKNAQIELFNTQVSLNLN